MIFKRIFDVVFSGVGLVVLTPLMVVIAILIRITMGPPVLFRQIRPGLKGVPFTLFKFRTMRSPLPGEAELETDAVRLTKLGKFLRKWSLDELPELWNVLKGDMSLVGPRPLLMEYLPRFDPEQARRMLVKPGLTGWAQIHGRNDLSWEEKFRLDLWYVDHQTCLLDMKILWQTPWVVLAACGIQAKGAATMPPFFGSLQNQSSDGEPGKSKPGFPPKSSAL
jgi:lipopolysaccharide/colanic/teichoic acid biosynthesis glycosyltransferase